MAVMLACSSQYAYSAGISATNGDLTVTEGLIDNSNGSIAINSENGHKISVLADTINAVAMGFGLQVQSKSSAQIGNENSTVSLRAINSNDIHARGVSVSGNSNASISGKEISIDAFAGSNTVAYGVYVKYDDKSNSPSTITIGTSKTEKISIVADGNGGSYALVNIKGSATLTANEIEIESTGLGLHVGNNTQDAMAPANRASTIVRAQKTTINAEAVGIGAFSNGLMDISGDLTVNAPNAIDVRGNSTVNINQDGKGVVILNGDIVFETPATPGDAQNSGEKINSYVNLNLTEGSQWNGRAYQEYGNKNPIQTVELENPPFYGNVTGFSVTIDNGAAWNMDGDSFVNTLEVKKGGAVNVQKDAALFNATEIKLSGGVIALEDVDQKLNINTLSGTDGTFNVKAARNSDGSFSKASINVKRVEKGMTITEAYSGVDADGISKSDLTKLRALNAPSGDLTLVQVVPEGDINGTMTYVTDADGTTTSSEVKNTRQDAYESLTSMNFLAWRHEMNDLT